MTSVFEDIKSYILERPRAYKRKVIRLVLIGLTIVVVGIASAIALSELLSKFLFSALGISVCVWLFLRVSKIEVSTILARLKAALDKILEFIRGKQQELRDLKKDPAKFSLLELLTFANDQERDGLERLSDIKFKDADQFEVAIRKKATHDVTLFLKRIKGVEQSLALTSYSEMLDLVGDHFKEKRDGQNDREFEVKLVEIAFKTMVESMDQKDRDVLEHEIKKYAEEHLGQSKLGITLSSSGVLAANLAGFSTYTMASSLLAGLGSMVGVTWPFAAYTTLSSALSVVLGPIGVGALGAWGLHKIASPNLSVTIKVVLAVAGIRERLIFERPFKEEKIRKELSDLSGQRDILKQLIADQEDRRTPNFVNLSLFENQPKLGYRKTEDLKKIE